MKISEWLKYNIERTEHDGFVISGARGSGKTTHMMAMAYELEMNKFRLRYVTILMIFLRSWINMIVCVWTALRLSFIKGTVLLRKIRSLLN